jgi:hypothetical protein
MTRSRGLSGLQYESLFPGGVKLAINFGTLGLPDQVNQPKFPGCEPFKMSRMTVFTATPAIVRFEIAMG